MTGNGLLDAGMDALLLDVSPPDWHGLGLGTGWAARAIGYSVSTILTLSVRLYFNWNAAFLLFLAYSIIPLSVFFVREPPATGKRKISKKAIALTFTNKFVLTWVAMAIFGCIIYTLDPARGFLSQLVNNILQTDPSNISGRIQNAWYSIVPFGISTAIASVGMGRTIDVIGHKKGYYISLLGAAFSVLPWCFVHDLITLIVASVVLGFFSGFTFTSWETVLADTIPSEFPAFLWQLYMGFLHLMAFIFGPILILIGTLFTIPHSLIFIAGISLVGFIPAALLQVIETSKKGGKE